MKLQKYLQPFAEGTLSFMLPRTGKVIEVSFEFGQLSLVAMSDDQDISQLSRKIVVVQCKPAKPGFSNYNVDQLKYLGSLNGHYGTSLYFIFEVES